MARAVYFDESGYTGGALLDPVQPLFCVASSLVGDSEAEGILRRAFPGYAAQEFKFQQLWRRDKTRGQLPALATELHAVQDRLFLWVIDKRFCVLTKLIDFLVEPVFHDMGRDFYKNGHAAKFSNYIHSGFAVVGSPELYEATIRPYYEFSRDPTEERLQELQRRLGLMATSGPKEMRFFYEMALKGARDFHRNCDITTFKDTFEIQLTSVLASVGYWRHLIPDDLELFHDASNNFFNQSSLWEAITADDVPAQFHPVANAPPMEFPLRVVSTKAKDSKESFAIQLCDVLAGLAVKFARERARDPGSGLVKDILDAGFGDLTYNGIRPGVDFPSGPPEVLDGPDVVDQLMAIIEPKVERG